MKRVAILISGGGSNMVELVKSMTGTHPARAVLVGSNNCEAGGLGRARQLGIASFCVDHRPFGKDRQAFERKLAGHLDAARPDIIALAGFMRILTPEFVGRYAGRILNIHPSLLPKYPGLNTHSRAIAAGDVEAGASVHLVTAGLDEGPVLGQARVPVLPDDNAADLAARVLVAEHQLYPAVLRRFAVGNTQPLDMGQVVA